MKEHRSFLKAAIYRLVGLYPRGWQERYREEFLALLEDYPLSWKVFFNVLWGALQAYRHEPKGNWRPVREFSSRLLIVLLIGLVASLVTWWFANEILVLLANLAGTYEDGFGSQSRLISTEIFPAFLYYFLIAFYGGTLLTSPFAIYFFFRFLAKRRLFAARATLSEPKNTEQPFGPVSGKKPLFFLSIPLLTVCWLGGVFFSYVVEIPATVKTLFNLYPVINVQSFIPLVSKVAFWTGLLFEIPAFLFLLGVFGFVGRKKLQLWWLVITFASVIFGELLLPSLDLLSVVIVAAAISGINIVGMVLVRVGARLSHPDRSEIASN